MLVKIFEIKPLNIDKFQPGEENGITVLALNKDIFIPTIIIKIDWERKDQKNVLANRERIEFQFV